MTPSSSPISSTIFPSFTFSTVVPVNFMRFAGVGRQRADQEVAEGRPGVRAAAFPAADDVVAFRDQVRGAPEVQVRERLAEVLHEGLDVVAAATRGVQGVLQQHVGSGQLVDDGGVVLLAPEMREPAADDGLVVILLST